MKRLLFATTCLSMVVLFTSCVTVQTISIDSLQPARVGFDNSLKKIVLVYPDSPSTIVVPEGTTASSDSLYARYLFDGVLSVLANSPRFQADTNVYIYPVASEDTAFRKFDWAQIANLASKHGADGVISVEFSKTDDKLSVPLEFHYESDQYYASMVFVNNIVWRIYDAQQKVLLDTYNQKDTVFWEASAYSVPGIREQLPTKDEAIITALFQTGKKFGQRIAPYWTKSQRFYYSGGNNKLKNASQLMQNNQYDQASVIYEDMVKNNSNNEMVSMAAFNLAVIAEVKDDLNQALEWAAKSYLEHPNEYSKSYIDILESRVKLAEKVNRQLEE